ncbi:MAG: A/G-specific adenine glycosylase [Eubacteriales bacterium]|nr:A/G-specific adenine glycosylase [Eubacteriales bacterium]
MKEKNQQGETILHPIPPLFDKESRILILGSFPSVKSREAAFFYGHPQNRFWKLMSRLLSEEFPETTEERAALMHRNHIAVWDTIASCNIVGSSDSSIKDVVPNDLSIILENAPIEKIYCNGAKSHEYYKKYIEKETGMQAIKLPSTSPANAACNMDKLIDQWKQILIPLKIAPAGIGDVLVRWYDYNARILPWRSDPTPYHVWISEIMLQQTRVEAVKKYYERWMDALPDIASLAAIDDDELMKLWEGLGYYSRVRNIKAAAITVMEEYGGQLPANYDQLLSLKGIGEYTAGAISSIAFHLPKAAVDGNVLRVFSRILAEEGKINQSKVKKTLEKEVLRVMPKERPGDFNQALMDLGATICLPNGKPLCEQCPWESVCQAHKMDRECDFPMKEQKKPRRIEEKGVFLIEWEGKIYLHKRPKKGLLAQLWEFPNFEGAYTLEKAREKIESWNGADYKIHSMGEGKHIFSHVEWHMTGYYIRLLVLSKKMKNLIEEKEWILVSKEEVENTYAIPSAFEAFRKRI